MRPSDLAREHGISAQAVRNYERDGFLPPAERTPSGYRIFTEVHAAALRAYLALVAGHGHAAGGRIMRAVHRGAPDAALAVIDQGHSQSLRDRETLDAVRGAVTRRTPETGDAPGRPIGPADPAADPAAGPAAHATHAARTIGELARRLEITPATLRNWEAAGILCPARDPRTGYRVFRAADVRDAELAHLLRRGGHPLEHIADVVRRIRTAGGADALSAVVDEWQRKLTARGLAMLDAAGRLSHYLSVLDRAGPEATGGVRSRPPAG
ncbi:TioE family transcriptional regulator [Streptomyces sp. PTD5-9]|uniref:TioE family transcriptional regulator n=1 Tax=Streptomyces sp. PTD5-9 TaxID=3120150 RepID=UPI0030081624